MKHPLLFFVLIVSFLISACLSREMDPSLWPRKDITDLDVLELAPPGTITISCINLEPLLRDEEFRQRFMTAMDAGSNEDSSMSSLEGINYIHGIVMYQGGFLRDDLSGVNKAADMMTIVVYGEYDRESILKQMAAGKKPSTHRGIELLSIPSQGSQAVFLDSSLLAVGSERNLKYIIDVHQEQVEPLNLQQSQSVLSSFGSLYLIAIPDQYLGTQLEDRNIIIHYQDSFTSHYSCSPFYRVASIGIHRQPYSLELILALPLSPPRCALHEPTRDPG